MRPISRLSAAGTALTNSTAETVLASIALPAYTLTLGKMLRLRCSVRTTAQNSTDTLTVRLRIGPTTLTGTAWFTSAATDEVVDDVCVIDLEIAVRAVSAAGLLTLVAAGSASPPDANGTAMVSIAPAPLTTLDIAAVQRIEVTGQWSVASASNSCQAEMFTVYEA